MATCEGIRKKKTKKYREREQGEEEENATLLDTTVPEAPHLSDFLASDDVTSSFVQVDNLGVASDVADNQNELDVQCEGLDEESTALLEEVNSEEKGYHQLSCSKVEPNQVYDSLQCELDALKEADCIELTSIERTVNSTKTEVAESESVAPTAPLQEYVPTANAISLDLTATRQFDQQTVKPYSLEELQALCQNPELEANESFVDEFIEDQSALDNHEFYKLLQDYLNACGNATVHKNDLRFAENECKTNENKLWVFETREVQESGECQDGNPVSAWKKYRTASLQEDVLQQLQRNLKNVREIAKEQLALSLYQCEMSHLMVDHYVSGVVSSSDFFLEMSKNAQVQSHPNISVDRGRINHLKTCISILFAFQRRPVGEKRFVNDTREWLSKLVGILLRVATVRDHMFLLCHVLRCPPRVAAWGTSFIQVMEPRLCQDTPTFSCPYLQHAVAVLGMLMDPAKKRAEFLALRNSVADDDNPWIVLDSDGEEEDELVSPAGHLQESDLMAIFNQLPFGPLFRHILEINIVDSQCVYDVRRTSSDAMLQLFALATQIIGLLQRGLQTYSDPRYSRFTKNLSRMISHVVQYVSEHWHNLKKENIHSGQLQAEFGSFYYRAVGSLFVSRRVGAWQFLATVPYEDVLLPSLWQMFYLLHLDSEDIMCLENVSEITSTECAAHVTDHSACSMLAFHTRLMEYPQTERFYLLLTFTNMAAVRTSDDWNFIQTVASTLFEVGFVNVVTTEACSKDARDLLVTLTTKHPRLFSVLLQCLQGTIDTVGTSSLYLFKELPLYYWLPTEADISVLFSWLIDKEPSSAASQLARQILSGLDWGCIPHLAIPLHIHRQVAIAIVQACSKHIPDRQQGGLLNESVRHVSNVATALGWSPAHQALNTWAWHMLSVVKLHLLSQGPCMLQFLNKEPAKALSYVVDPDRDPSVDLLLKGMSDQQPLASFALFLMSSWGHSVPLICTKGCQLLETLVMCGRYEAVIEAFYYIVPIFLQCPDSLYQLERFSSIVTSVVSADLTYMKMAKNLLVTNFPGNILKKMGEMIVAQLRNCIGYGFDNPSGIVNLWLHVLSSVADWTKERPILYLVNLILKTAFMDDSSFEAARTIIGHLYNKSLGASRQGAGVISSLFSWVGGSGTLSNSLLVKGFNSECPWFAFFVLEVEMRREGWTRLWKQLLEELVMNEKLSVDQALKKACSSLGVGGVSTSSLLIYRWALQALETPVDHLLLPVFWQYFFMLYLQRVPLHSNSFEQISVGERFFVGMSYYNYLKRMKRRLQEITEYYENKEKDVNASESPEASSYKAFLERCRKLFSTFSLWLEEPQLHQASVYLPALPPQYCSSMLTKIFSFDKKIWMEYIDVKGIYASQEAASTNWIEQHNKTDSIRFAHQIRSEPEEDTPTARIIKRVQSYDTPVPPPPVAVSDSRIPRIKHNDLYVKKIVLDTLQATYSSILDFAELFALRSSHHVALDCAFTDLLPELYRHAEKEIVIYAACDDGISQHHRNASRICAGAAPIPLKYLEAVLNIPVDERIQQNRREYDELMTQFSKPPTSKLCCSVLTAKQFVDALVLEHKEKPNDPCLEEVGSAAFYYVASLFTEDIFSYLPAKQLLTTVVETLGQEFIMQNPKQCLQLLTVIMEKPNLMTLLTPNFSPSVADPPVLLAVYEKIVLLGQKNIDLAFVLLTKINLQQWFTNVKHKLGDVSHLITLVFKALCIGGQKPEPERQMLHDMYCVHLRLLLLQDKPEHYGEVFQNLLKGTEDQMLGLDVWYAFINVFATTRYLMRPDMDAKEKWKELRTHAMMQNYLGRQELYETAQYLTTYFNSAREKYGLHGLYPKYSHYLEPISCFISLIVNSLIVTMLQASAVTLAEDLMESLWPMTRDTFAAWIVPVTSENCASWIQELKDDHTMLMPWTGNDSKLANDMFSCFINSVQFMFEMMPGCTSILSRVWQFYAKMYAHKDVEEHVLTIVHTQFLQLPWHKFLPSGKDVEAMHKVVNQYLSSSHVFLGKIFVQISWTEWLPLVLNTNSLKSLTWLLVISVKLSAEPQMSQSVEMIDIISKIEGFPWHLIEAAAYEDIFNWFLISAEPKIIIETDGQQSVHRAALRLLQVAAGFERNVLITNHTSYKCCVFIRSWARLLVTAAAKYRSLASSHSKQFSNAIVQLFNSMELIISDTKPIDQQQYERAVELVRHFLIVCAGAPSNNLVHNIVLQGLRTWCLYRNAHSPVLQATIHLIVPSTATVPTSSAICLEDALQSYFQPIDPSFGFSQPSWEDITRLLQCPEPSHLLTMVEQCAKDGLYLSWYAVLHKRVSMCKTLSDELFLLNSTLDLLKNHKPQPNYESKALLMWLEIIRLVQRQATGSVNIRKQTQMLITTWSNLGEEKGAWAILGAVGLSKSKPLTLRGQIICRCLSVYLQMQCLPTGEIRNGIDASRVHGIHSEEIGLISHPKAQQNMEKLRNLLTVRQYSDVHHTIENALVLITDKKNSLHNFDAYLHHLVVSQYNETFLQAAFSYLSA